MNAKTSGRLSAGRSLVVAACLILALTPLVGYADEWKISDDPWKWVFPLDHGAHPEFRTEWWYFTGNLQDRDGGQFGYQLTFFRQGLRLTAADPENPWSVRDLYLAHFTVTDVRGKRFHFAERVSREGPGLAGAARESMKIHLLDWSAAMEGEMILIKARHGATELSLRLLPRKAPVLHGTGGISRKGPGRGQTSYYASLTDLDTSGSLSLDGRSIEVRGTSWFDHEFGSNQLTAEQSGWDWFGLHLDDGRDLMVYLIRRADGSIEPSSSGTLVEKDGSTRHLKLNEIAIQILGRWKSPRSSASYPSGWRIRVDSARIDVTIVPLLKDQELVTSASTGITYWEGAVQGDGQSAGRRVTTRGYVELTGYAGRLGGVF